LGKAGQPGKPPLERKIPPAQPAGGILNIFLFQEAKVSLSGKVFAVV
jgi:hypothetical protein